MTTDTELHRIIRKLAEAQLPDGSVPFASLRVTTQRGYSHAECVGLPLCQLTALSFLEIRDCDGRGWVPEPNRRVALWEILRGLPNEIQLKIIQGGLDEQACLTEAQQWLDEKMKEVT